MAPPGIRHTFINYVVGSQSVGGWNWALFTPSTQGDIIQRKIEGFTFVGNMGFF